MKQFKFFNLIASLIIFFGFTVDLSAQVYNPYGENFKEEVEAVRRYLNNAIQKYELNRSQETQNSENDKKDYSKFDEDDNALNVFGVNNDDPGLTRRKSVIMNNNKITVEIFNYGGIGPGYGLIRNVSNLVWRDVGYIFTFSPVVGASVPDDDDPNKRLHIISDGVWDYPYMRDVSPDGDSLWQFEPLAGYDDPTQDNVASNPAPDSDGDGKPDSWPRSWYNETLGRYVWPGYLTQDVLNADMEVYWAMDDRNNSEFNYYPYNNDRDKRGLGIQIDGRIFQWSNALAENTLFAVYTITNKSDKDLDSVFFGIYGDPDLGGGTPENVDDYGLFIPPYAYAGYDSAALAQIPVYSRSMSYFWDSDNQDPLGRFLGYLGCKFLESPGDPDNGIDDDGDGMVDESQFDGIDNDGDWFPALHDVGIDGIPNTGDEGEGDGYPTAGQRLPDGSPHPLYPGEPNFEYTDLDEADQIGLTSFNSWAWVRGSGIKEDEQMWNRCIPGTYTKVQREDLLFIFGSGYMQLKKGETKRISMAFLMGEDLADLLISARVVQDIYNRNYQFFKPPNTPTVFAVPGDKKVTLYWDDYAEESVDPVTGEDFEGYVIYRSTDPTFQDIQVITDGRGSSFLHTPLTDERGGTAKWDVDKRDEPFVDANGNGKYDPGEKFTDWDENGSYSRNIDDFWTGYHPIPYQERGVHYYLGDNTGLVHQYVDSNNVVNGKQYYYAVVAYDHGDTVGIPVTETSKKITEDPITGELQFDRNTVGVVPGPRASGYMPPELGDDNVTRVEGTGTGEIKLEILDDLEVADNQYVLKFNSQFNGVDTTYARKNYSILDTKVYKSTITLYGTKFANLGVLNISDDSHLSVKSTDGTITYQEGVDYDVRTDIGSIKRTENSSIPDRGDVEVAYRYFPIYQSTNLDGEDNNPVFDGVKVFVTDEEELAFDYDNSGWQQGNCNYDFTLEKSTLGQSAIERGSYTIEFFTNPADGDSAYAFVGGSPQKIAVNYKVNYVLTGQPQPVQTFLSESGTPNQIFEKGDRIIFYRLGADELTDSTSWSFGLTTLIDSTETPIPPSSGDIVLLETSRPFNDADSLLINTSSGGINQQLAAKNLDNVYVVPNPYIGYNELEPTNKLPGQSRGERRIYFENLPPECTIRIFTMSGEMVKKIEHESAGFNSGRETWNLLNEDGFSVAYGIYIAHIDAPGIGEKIVKFALIK